MNGFVVFLLDALLAGLILVTFAFFHHVLPAMISEFERQQAQLNATVPVQTEAPELIVPDTLPQV